MGYWLWESYGLSIRNPCILTWEIEESMCYQRVWVKWGMGYIRVDCIHLPDVEARASPDNGYHFSHLSHTGVAQPWCLYPMDENITMLSVDRLESNTKSIRKVCRNRLAHRLKGETMDFVKNILHWVSTKRNESLTPIAWMFDFDLRHPLFSCL